MKLSYIVVIVCIVLLFNIAYAGEYKRHHNIVNTPIIINVQSNTPDAVNNYPAPNNNNCEGDALAGASGQHNYRGHKALQWSAASVYTNQNGCDASAVSFGLAKKLGKVFSAFNYSTNFDGFFVGVSASGTF